MQSLEFTINGEYFLIEQYAKGWCWVSGELGGEYFPTALEAQQDAINNERERLQEPPAWSMAAAELEDARKEY